MVSVTNISCLFTFIWLPTVCLHFCKLLLHCKCQLFVYFLSKFVKKRSSQYCKMRLLSDFQTLCRHSTDQFFRLLNKSISITTTANKAFATKKQTNSFFLYVVTVIFFMSFYRSFLASDETLIRRQGGSTPKISLNYICRTSERCKFPRRVLFEFSFAEKFTGLKN